MHENQNRTPVFLISSAHVLMRLLLLAGLVLILGQCVMAQVGIRTDTPDPSAVLDVVSQDKGVLIPRVTLTADLNNPAPVTSPAVGLLVFNDGPQQEQGFYFWSGSAWVLLRTDDGTVMTGPGSSTDNALARFDGTDGNKLQNSGVILDDAGNMSGINHLTTLGLTLPTGAASGKILGSDAAGNASWVDPVLPDIEEDDILIVPNVNTLNFQGAVDVQNDGGNKASVSVSESISEEQVIQVSATRSLDLNVFFTPVAIPWDMELIKDAATFQHNNLVKPTRITVLKNGTYEINYMFSFDNTNNKRKTLQSRIRVNGTDYIQASSAYGFIYSSDDDKASLVSSSFLIDLEVGDYVEVMVNGRTNEGAVNLIENENLLYVRVMRTW